MYIYKCQPPYFLGRTIRRSTSVSTCSHAVRVAFCTTKIIFVFFFRRSRQAGARGRGTCTCAEMRCSVSERAPSADAGCFVCARRLVRSSLCFAPCGPGQ